VQVKSGTVHRKESSSTVGSILSPIPKKGTATAKKRSSKLSPKVKIDQDVAEALQRHNLGSLVTLLVVGSPLASPNGKSKKDGKKNGRSLEKRLQDSTGKLSLGRLDTKEKNAEKGVNQEKKMVSRNSLSRALLTLFHKPKRISTR
jgi:hypothetical protein